LGVTLAVGDLRRVLEPGYHHKAVISKVGIAGEGAAALPVLAPPALELPVSLVETDFEGALRAVDDAVQGVQEVWPVAGDDDETTFHWPTNFGCGEKPIPAFSKNGNTLRLVGGEGKRKNHRDRSAGEIVLPAAVQSWFGPQPNPQMPSGGGVRAKGSWPRQPLAFRRGDLVASDAPPGTCRPINEDAGLWSSVTVLC